MTYPPRSEFEPVDPSVRTFLWRLRARLVNPPHEERVAADLDRLFDAAREHAHDEPLFGDLTGHDGATTTSVPTAADASTPAADGDTEELPDGVAPIFGAAAGEASPFASRHLGSLFGRVAAAAVLLAAVGGGIAGARDGNVSLNALLGRSGTPEVDASEDDLLALDAVPEASVADAPEPDPAPSDDAGEAVSDDPAEASQAPSDEAPAEPAEDESPPDSPEPSERSGSEDATPNDPEPEADAEEPAPEPVEDEGEIIAAPPAEPEPRPVDGFGGPTCPEDGDPALCDPDGSDADAGDGTVDGDGDGGDTTGDTDGASDDGDTAEQDDVDTARDELARRRGGA